MFYLLTCPRAPYTYAGDEQFNASVSGQYCNHTLSLTMNKLMKAEVA